ncbi:hypothetical protein SBOR_0408 [Sclerotinia borealis F-4128]|uniref:Uncharacterized protein n=1 Tax=Sclerotinia borealis (strain F-4128) TaxID=1432307 RepID=W9CTI5_SCLBF|nr:hypothetical protein SBOR_0408 [Sclerotinia borealis F-4128]
MCQWICTVELCPTCGKKKKITDQDGFCESNSSPRTPKDPVYCQSYREYDNIIFADSPCRSCDKKDSEEKKASPPTDSTSNETAIQELMFSKKPTVAKESDEVSEDDRDPDERGLDDGSISEVSAFSDDSDDELFSGDEFDEDDERRSECLRFGRLRTRVEEVKRMP